MKSFIFTALLIGAASQAAGCIIVDDDEDTGNINVTWDTVTADANGNPVQANCPAGASSAIIYSLLEGAPAGDAYIDKYNCGDFAGTAADLPSGRYTVWVRLTDTSEATRFAESAAQVIDVPVGGSTSADFQIFNDHAFYLAGWNLRPNGGAAIPCSQVAGENGVSITATDSGGALLDTTVDCEEGLAPLQTITRPLPSSLSGAQYSIVFSLLNAQDQSIGDSQTLTPSPERSLDYGNEYQDLGIVDINLI